jgi:hypothetical protein
VDSGGAAELCKVPLAVPVANINGDDAINVSVSFSSCRIRTNSFSL